MLGGFVHVEIPMNLTAMIEAMTYTCQMVHLISHNQHLSSSGVVFLRHALMAMEDNCRSEEIALGSLIKSLGSREEWEKTYGDHELNPLEAERKWIKQPGFRKFPFHTSLDHRFHRKTISRDLPLKVTAKSGKRKPEKVDPKPNKNFKVQHYLNIPPYFTKSYIAFLKEYKQKIDADACTPLELYTHTWMYLESYDNHRICKFFVFPENEDTRYYRADFFRDDNFRRYLATGELTPIRKSYHEAWTRGYRNTRQIFLAGLAATAGVLFSSIATDVLGWLGFKRADGATAEEVERVNENTHHEAEIANHLGRLEWVTRQLKSKEVGMMEESKLMQHVMSFQGTFEGFMNKVRRVEEGLSVLLHTGNLSPSLVDAHQLYSATRDLEMAAGKRNELLLLENYSDLWKAEVSYFLMKDLTMMLVLHVPVGRADSQSRLYRYVPTPMEMVAGNVSHKFLVTPPDHVLSFNPRTQVKTELTNSELQACPKVAPHVRYCPRWGYQYKMDQHTCLMALFSGKAVPAARLCPVTEFPEEPFVAQVNLRQYYVYAPRVMVGRVSCEGRVGDKVEHLEGLQMITLRPDCRLDSEAFTLEPMVEFGEKTEGVQAVSLKFNDSHMGDAMNWAVKGGHLKDLADNNAPTLAEMSVRWRHDDLKVQQHWSLLHWMVVVSVTVAVVMFLLWMIKCIYDVRNRGKYRDALTNMSNDVRNLYRRAWEVDPPSRPESRREPAVRFRNRRGSVSDLAAATGVHLGDLESRLNGSSSGEEGEDEDEN